MFVLSFHDEVSLMGDDSWCRLVVQDCVMLNRNSVIDALAQYLLSTPVIKIGKTKAVDVLIFADVI